jgi:GxxExxY protein
VFDDIIVEIKAKESIADEDYAQAINYLKVSGNKVGLIINFGKASLEFKRVSFKNIKILLQIHRLVVFN